MSTLNIDFIPLLMINIQFSTCSQASKTGSGSRLSSCVLTLMKRKTIGSGSFIIWERTAPAAAVVAAKAAEAAAWTGGALLMRRAWLGSR